MFIPNQVIMQNTKVSEVDSKGYAGPSTHHKQP